MKKKFQFKKHYTVEEARALLPQIRKWLEQIEFHQERIGKLDKRIEQLTAKGDDVGGNSVTEWLKCLAQLRELVSEFEAREIQIKSVERGLIDFPALRDGREIFLCWEKSEEDIEHWHDLDTGYDGREPL